MRNNSLIFAQKIASVIPPAFARLSGENDVRGNLSLYATLRGMLVVAEIYGLPYSETAEPENHLGLFLFEEDASAPPVRLMEVISNGGYSWSAVLNELYPLKGVIGIPVRLCPLHEPDTILAAGRIEKSALE